MTGGYVPQGSSIRFSLPPDFDVVDTVIESAQKIKDTTLRDADAMIVFSCIGRFSTLGPLIEDVYKRQYFLKPLATDHQK